MTEPSRPPPVNPYAAPEAEVLEAAPVEPTRSLAFYGVSPHKVVLMSVLTMGVYDLAFWWRHWRTRSRPGAKLSVLLRTLFAPFFGFDFKNAVVLALVERDLAVPRLLGAAPLIYLCGALADSVLSRATDPTLGVLGANLGLLLVRSSSLFVIQGAINEVLEADGNGPLIQRGATLRTYVAALLGLAMWGLLLLAALFPDPAAVAGQ